MEKEIFKLDRIEENIAALENPEGRIIFVPKDLLPENSESGDCFISENGSFSFDPEETEKRRKIIVNLLDKIIGKSNI